MQIGDISPHKVTRGIIKETGKTNWDPVNKMHKRPKTSFGGPIFPSIIGVLVKIYPKHNRILLMPCDIY